MCRKALVAGIAVVVSLLAVNYVFPRTFSFIRLWVHDAREAADDSIPLEKEIARLKLEVDNLAKEDERRFHKVAVQVVEVQKLEKQVAETNARLEKDAAIIRARKASLDAKGDFVSYEGQKFERTRFEGELYELASRFQVEEEEFKSKEEQLSLRKKNLELNRKKLSELRLTRQKLKTRLERLEAKLAAYRQRQAMDESVIDDPDLQKLLKEIEAAEDKQEVNEQKAALKTEVNGGVRAAEERNEKKAAINKFLTENPRLNNTVSKDKQ